jgi:hypothetical protein
MKASKSPEKLDAPVFPQTMHRMRPNPAAIAKTNGPVPKPEKRDNIFSKSRDVREDRGARQMKTTHSSQTFTRNGSNSSR